MKRLQSHGKNSVKVIVMEIHIAEVALLTEIRGLAVPSGIMDFTR